MLPQRLKLTSAPFKDDRKGLIKSATTTSQFQHSVGIFSAIWLVVRSTFNGPSTSALPLSLFLLRSIHVLYTCTLQKRAGKLLLDYCRNCRYCTEGN